MANKIKNKSKHNYDLFLLRTISKSSD